MRTLVTAMLLTFASFLPLSAVAQQTEVDETYSMPLDGLDIEFDESGDWVRIYSTYRQPVAVPDRAGLRKGYTIAAEKGKAQIIRFFEERVTSKRLIEEVSRESQNAVRSQKDGQQSVSRETQREMVESIKEFTESFSEGTLRGVTVLEQGYDEAAEEVWVKIGISKKNAALGAKLQQDLRSPARTGSQRSDSTGVGIFAPTEARRRPPESSYH